MLHQRRTTKMLLLPLLTLLLSQQALAKPLDVTARITMLLNDNISTSLQDKAEAIDTILRLLAEIDLPAICEAVMAKADEVTQMDNIIAQAAREQGFSPVMPVKVPEMKAYPAPADFPMKMNDILPADFPLKGNDLMELAKKQDNSLHHPRSPFTAPPPALKLQPSNSPVIVQRSHSIKPKFSLSAEARKIESKNTQKFERPEIVGFNLLPSDHYLKQLEGEKLLTKGASTGTEKPVSISVEGKSFEPTSTHYTVKSETPKETSQSSSTTSESSSTDKSSSFTSTLSSTTEDIETTTNNRIVEDTSNANTVPTLTFVERIAAATAAIKKNLSDLKDIRDIKTLSNWRKIDTTSTVTTTTTKRENATTLSPTDATTTEGPKVNVTSAGEVYSSDLNTTVTDTTTNELKATTSYANVNTNESSIEANDVTVAHEVTTTVSDEYNATTSVATEQVTSSTEDIISVESHDVNNTNTKDANSTVALNLRIAENENTTDADLNTTEPANTSVEISTTESRTTTSSTADISIRGAMSPITTGVKKETDDYSVNISTSVPSTTEKSNPSSSESSHMDITTATSTTAPTETAYTTSETIVAYQPTDIVAKNNELSSNDATAENDSVIRYDIDSKTSPVTGKSTTTKGTEVSKTETVNSETSMTDTTASSPTTTTTAASTSVTEPSAGDEDYDDYSDVTTLDYFWTPGQTVEATDKLYEYDDTTNDDQATSFHVSMPSEDTKDNTNETLNDSTVPATKEQRTTEPTPEVSTPAPRATPSEYDYLFNLVGLTGNGKHETSYQNVDGTDSFNYDNNIDYATEDLPDYFESLKTHAKFLTGEHFGEITKEHDFKLASGASSPANTESGSDLMPSNAGFYNSLAGQRNWQVSGKKTRNYVSYDKKDNTFSSPVTDKKDGGTTSDVRKNINSLASAFGVKQKTVWSEPTLPQIFYHENGYACPGLFGYYADADDCRAFFICSWGMPYRFLCPKGTLWNSAESVCDWANNVICTKTK